MGQYLSGRAFLLDLICQSYSTFFDEKRCNFLTEAQNIAKVLLDFGKIFLLAISRLWKKIASTLGK